MLKKTIITIAISAVIGGAVALAPVDAFARGGGGGGGHGVAVVVVTVVVGSAVVMAAAGSPEDMVVGSPVGMVAGLAAAASVAVGAELVLGQL